jgi:SAM-dependent methyltransferase
VAKATYSEISACRICGNRHLDPVFNLGEQYLTGVFPKSAQAQRALTRGPLELVKCRAVAGDTCGLLQLRQSYAAPEMYGANYGYRSGLNRSMVEHLHGKVKRILQLRPLRDGECVLDIGSNDGTLLSAYPGTAQRFGMDPSAEKFRKYYPPDVRLVTDFFSAAKFAETSGGRKAAVVTSIAMFYDLEQPLEFVHQVKGVLADDGLWVFEQSYMPSMLDTGSYDTICHEHVEYYALEQIKWLLDRAGMRILEVELNAVNGGSFSITAARAPGAEGASVARLLAAERAAGLDTTAPYERFAKRALRHRDELTALVHGIKARGQKIFGYGASTKGNVILQFCGLGKDDIACIAEVNEDKFGAFTPGTGIPIVSEAEAKARKPEFLLVLPWHFRDNILQREAAWLRSGGKLVFPLPEIQTV